MADDKSSLDANKGSVGSAFRPDGEIGKQGQKLGTRDCLVGQTRDHLHNIPPGGPFDKDGAIGKEFKSDGSVGGTAQNSMTAIRI